MTYRELVNPTAAGLALIAAAAWAVPSVSAPDTITNASIGVEVEIVQGLGLALHSTPLSFGGVIIASAGSCEVLPSLPPTSAISCTGASVVSGGPSPASTFNITGGAGLGFDITLPADGVVSLTGAGTPMSLTGFADTHGGSGVIGTTTDTFTVGATVNFSGTQAPGNYSATFFVGVAYN